MPLNETKKQRLAKLAGRLITEDVVDQERVDGLRRAVRGLLDDVLDRPTTEADEIEELATVPTRLDDAPPRLRKLLVRLLGEQTVRERRDARLGGRPEGRLAAPPRVHAAAARIALEGDNAQPEDIDTVERWLDGINDRRHQPMAMFYAETRSLPPKLRDPERFEEFKNAVSERLRKIYRLPEDGNEAWHAVVLGKLLLEGQTDTEAAGHHDTLRAAFLAGLDTSRGVDDHAVPNHETYAAVADALTGLPGHGEQVAYQELASVAEHVVDEAEAWPVDDQATLGTRVQMGVNRYVDGTADVGFSALDLPPIVSEDASEQEIGPANVQAVGFFLAGAELEAAGVFDVVDRMVDLFLQGMLPVGNDPGGAALNRYYWDADERLDPAARAAQYARVLGAGGGSEAPRDVQPNAAFTDLFFRAVSSIARYDADLRVSSLFDGRPRNLRSSGEYVRKSLHDLAANASLYGWGFTTFAAKSLKRHIDLAFDVLSEPTLQRAYGVTGAWQLVERVASIELGSAPNVVQHRTMAKATKDVLDLLAKYSRELSVSGAYGRFLPGTPDDPEAAVSPEDYDRLATAAHNVLAVNGMGHEDIDRMSKPTRASHGPSIPTVVGNGNGHGNGGVDASGAIDQIRQLVLQGQTPSLEQLQRLIPMGG